MGQALKAATYHYQHRVTVPIMRAVWAAVTAEPQITVVRLAAQTGHSPASVAAALHQLREMEYIDFEPGHEGTRRILLPYYTVRRKRHARTTPRTR